MSSPDPQATKMRSAIRGFLQERFDAKTEKLSPGDEAYQKRLEEFDYDNWLADAGRRVSQLQVVTHSLKPTHPDAKGSSIYAPPSGQLPQAVIGTDALGEQFAIDVVGNAAALDVFSFLKMAVDERTLLERVEQSDPALKAALSDNADTGRQLMQQFATITQPGEHHASNTKAKQLFWIAGDDISPIDGDAFDLLAPLYATTLAHQVFQTVNRDRFSDEAKAARKARWNDKPHETGYCVYPGLATQRFGGSKPQNISQLNSERGSNGYLFSCAPPLWRSRTVTPIYSDTAFRAYRYRDGVRAAIRDLGKVLTENAANNMHVRNRRDRLTAQLVDELIVFTSEMRQLPAGWTADWCCRLPIEQQYWLDPYRAETDTEFARTLKETDWLTAICGDFSRWLLARLEYYWKLVMDDAAYRHFKRTTVGDMNLKNMLEDELKDWQAQLDKELAALEEVYGDDE